jgi:release factor glutamine methyltransferase
VSSPESVPPPALNRGGGTAGATGTTTDALVTKAADALLAAGFDAPRRRARRLVAAVLGLSDADVFAHPERRVEETGQARLSGALARMLAHEPLSRIVGRREFWGLDLLLSADTLDPRPDTETVVEAVLAALPGRDRPCRFLDLGTGTGCLLLALLSECPAARGIGIDIAPGAARTARRNASRLGLAGRADFIVGNWAEAIAGRFDAIVANPPYIARAAIAELPPEVREHDPVAALDGGPDGLAAYRAIAADLGRLLPPEGIFATEIGVAQAGPVSAILDAAGFGIAAVVPDLAGIERCIVARRRRRRRD